MYVQQRAYINSINKTLNKLNDINAEFKGKYAYSDYVYNKLDKNINFNDYMIRIRVYDNQTNVEKELKQNRITIKDEYHTLDEAQELIKNTHNIILYYKCTGWKFIYHDCIITINNVPNLNPIIEIFASNKDKIKNLFNLFEIKELITDTIPFLIFNI